MIDVLRNRTYATLFSAQVIALLGTGLLTIALGLLAFDIAGEDAGAVLGTALTIKMVAYVGIAPIISAITGGLSRKTLLTIAGLVRGAVALCLPFVSEPWHIYVLIFLLQSASATFTPAFQAVIPAVLPDERDYTRALSLSRLAYDLESLLSPALAAALLTVVAYDDLFLGTVVGFIVSAGMVLATRFPDIPPADEAPIFDRLTRGLRLFLGRAQLRSLLFLNLAVAAATAMVVVNTVVIVQGGAGRPQSDVAIALGAYGAGSMLIALSLPKLLDAVSDRIPMLVGAAMSPVGLVLAALALGGDGELSWPTLLGIWFALGAGASLILTPSARLLRRNVDESELSDVFVAQFSLSHACFLITYPIAGSVGAAVGMSPVAWILAGVGVVGAAVAWAFWRR